LKISIIIPTLNEATNIQRLLAYINDAPGQDLLAEVLIIDAGSTDDTIAIGKSVGAQALLCPDKGRACQMNYGASIAKGDVLHFIHADVLPPKTFLLDIYENLSDEHQYGCFSYKFDKSSPGLRFNEMMIRFDWVAVGGGDQTLFIKKDFFYEIGGFKEKLPIMEDFDFVWRAKRKAEMCYVKKDAIVSARKFEENSYVKVQLANIFVFFLFRLGVSPHFLAKFYRGVLK